MNIGDLVEVESHPGFQLKGRILAFVDWDGVPMALVRYDAGEPARRPYGLWQLDQVKLRGQRLENYNN